MPYNQKQLYNHAGFLSCMVALGDMIILSRVQLSKTAYFGSLMLLIIFLISGCSGRLILAPEASITRLAQGGGWKNEVDRLVNPLIKSKENVGVVVAILDENQQTEIFPYGLRNKESQLPVNKETLFGVGSVTKSMVVSLMLVLNQRGILSIDDKIGDLFPADIQFKDPRIRDITFAQLASHTSGLPREPVKIESLIALIYYTFTNKNIYSHLTKEAIYNYLQELELPQDPVAEPTYSNIGIGLLAHFLTLKTGQDLESLLNQYLFKPLDMKHTVIALKPEDKARLATGYAGDQPKFIPRNTPLENWTFSSVMVGTGGAYSTAEDLIRYLKAHLGMSNTSLDVALQKSRKILGQDGSHFLTMGWYVDYLSEYGTYLYYYHGMISGFNCYIGFEPVSQVAVVVLRNNFNWEDVVGHNLLLRLSRYVSYKKSNIIMSVNR